MLVHEKMDSSCQGICFGHPSQASKVPFLPHWAGNRNLILASAWGEVLSKALSHSARLKRQHQCPRVILKSWNMGRRKSCTPCNFLGECQSSPSGKAEETCCRSRGPPRCFWRHKSFCTGSQVGHCLQSSKTGQKQVTQLMDSLIRLPSLCITTPAGESAAHRRETQKDFTFFPTKTKLQRAERDKQSSKHTSVKLLLLLPHPTNPDAKPRELS